MIKSVLVILAIVLVAVFAHEHGEKQGEKHGLKASARNASICHYKTTKGVDYDLRLLDHSSVTDLQYFDAASSTTFYFRPCGPVSSYKSCPTGSSVCMVSSSGKAVNFGSAKAIQWADGVEDHAAVEAAYGSGEVCNNGASRKTFVEYVCNLQKTTPSAITSVTMIDDCTAKFIIESAYACPVKNFCASLTSSETCSNQLSLCQWSGGKCEAASGCWVSRQLNAFGVHAKIVLIAIAGLLSVCTFGLCACTICRRRRRAVCKRRGVVARCSRKNAKKTPAKKVAKNENVEYAPFQMPFQLVPGGFAPVNPYSNIQGYPMVNLSAPTDENEQV